MCFILLKFIKNTKHELLYKKKQQRTHDKALDYLKDNNNNNNNNILIK
jgi:hypothetical protein